MGDVFAAEDLSLGRRVAVKVLHPQFASDTAFVARFRREAQNAAGLNHPNIVSIYDFGNHEDVHRRLGRDVTERDHGARLGDDGGGDLS